MSRRQGPLPARPRCSRRSAPVPAPRLRRGRGDRAGMQLYFGPSGMSGPRASITADGIAHPVWIGIRERPRRGGDAGRDDGRADPNTGSTKVRAAAAAHVNPWTKRKEKPPRFAVRHSSRSRSVARAPGDMMRRPASAKIGGTARSSLLESVWDCRFHHGWDAGDEEGPNGPGPGRIRRVRRSGDPPDGPQPLVFEPPTGPSNDLTRGRLRWPHLRQRPRPTTIVWTYQQGARLPALPIPVSQVRLLKPSMTWRDSRGTAGGVGARCRPGGDGSAGPNPRPNWLLEGSGRGERASPSLTQQPPRFLMINRTPTEGRDEWLAAARRLA
jgi:hypothetical protein